MINEKRKMKNVKCILILLILSQFALGQAGETTPGKGEITILDRIIHDENIIIAEHGFIRGDIASRSASIYFDQNISAIDPQFKYNLTPAVQKSVTDLKDFIRNGWEIENILIEGWSSPEGSMDYNHKIALDRAESGKVFIKNLMKEILKEENKSYGISDPGNEINLEVISHGEDLEGLLYGLEVSGIPDKEDIISSLSGKMNEETKEKELVRFMDMYPEIKSRILPLLRRIKITVSCFESQLSDEKMLEIALSNPGSLKYKELLYTATLTENLEEKLSIYESAGERYPEDWKSFNNAGAIYLFLGENEKAVSYFNRANSHFPKNGIILNNMSVGSIGFQDVEKAKYYLNQAEIEGIDIAYNKGILKLMQEDYREAASLLSSERCNYNFALGLAFSDNLEKAADVLSCSPESAQKYYLLAVIGARKNDVKMVYDNILKTLERDPSMKVMIESDKEFSNYWDQLDFKELIK